MAGRTVVMESNKSGRVATAIGFLCGLIACLDALRDRKIDWPPVGLWEALPPPRRLELEVGIALILLSLIAMVLRNRSA